AQPNPAHVGRRASRSVRTGADGNHEHAGRRRHLGRTALGRGSGRREPSLPAGRVRCRRALGRDRARRARTQPARNRPFAVESDGGHARSTPAPHRRGVTAVQSPRARRRAAATRAAAGRAASTRAVYAYQLRGLSTMTIRHLLTASTFVLALAGAAVAQAPEPAPVPAAVPAVPAPPIAPGAV